jgi:hypothetical protein
MKLILQIAAGAVLAFLIVVTLVVTTWMAYLHWWPPDRVIK